MSSPEQDNQEAESEEEVKRVPAFLRSDRKVLGVLVFLFLILLIGRWIYLSGTGMEPIEIDRESGIQIQYQLEINQASWIEWVQLEGVGETLARKIVDYREKNGPFQEIEDLTKINGIGKKTLDKFRPWIRLDKSPVEPKQPIKP
jgi:competence protein ComEA